MNQSVQRLKTELENADAIYACVNYGEAFCPEEIRERSVCIDADIGDILLML